MSKNELVPLIIALIGILGSFATFLSLKSPNKELFTIIALCLTLLALIIFCNSYLGLKKSLKNLRALKQLGITELNSRGDNNKILNAKLKNTKTLKIIAISAINLLRYHREAIISLLVDNCATIKILIADEVSSVVNQIEDLTSEEHKDMIKNNIKTAEKLIEEYYKVAKLNAGENQIGKIYLGKYDTHYKVPIIILDDKYGFLTITLPPKKSLTSFTLVMEDINKGLLQDSILHFDRTWEYISKQNKIREF